MRSRGWNWCASVSVKSVSDENNTGIQEREA